MTRSGRRNPLLLFAGDIAALALSLYLTLWLRYGEIPTAQTISPYVLPFAILFGLWTLVFYSSGLYGKRLALFPSRVPAALLKTQFVNILFAALFFFLIPTFGITPKTILVLYLITSLIVIATWRLGVYPLFTSRRAREQAALAATGGAAEELYSEVNGNPHYDVEFCSRDMSDPCATIVIVDTKSAEAVARNLSMYADKQIIPLEDFYEEIFDRIPLSELGLGWFQEHTIGNDSFWYRVPKRAMDIVGGILMGLITLVVLPFVWIAIRLEGPGPLFIVQERFGKYGELMKAYKFRSMTKNEAASSQWVGESENRVTRVGAFLRKTSLDEFPQFINVLRGELSLIGPRNDTLGLGERLAEALPYYEARYLIIPGITGWAQINQQYEQGNISPQSIEETKMRLAYDFYYLKHRSLTLDLIIALKTVKKMFFRVSAW